MPPPNWARVTEPSGKWAFTPTKSTQIPRTYLSVKYYNRHRQYLGRKGEGKDVVSSGRKRLRYGLLYPIVLAEFKVRGGGLASGGFQFRAKVIGNPSMPEVAKVGGFGVLDPRAISRQATRLDGAESEGTSHCRFGSARLSFLGIES